MEDKLLRAVKLVRDGLPAFEPKAPGPPPIVIFPAMEVIFSNPVKLFKLVLPEIFRSFPMEVILLRPDRF